MLSFRYYTAIQTEVWKYSANTDQSKDVDLGGVNIKSIFGFQYLQILNEMTQEKEWYAAYRAEQEHHEHVPTQISFKKKKTVWPYDRQPKKQSQQ